MQHAIKELRLTILADNRAHDARLFSGHGLSIWIEAGGRTVLFDTGQNGIIFLNGEILGIDLAAADMLVLSHGHYDHSGGVSALLEINQSARIYCHPGIFVSRYSRRADASVKEIGMSRAAGDSLQKCAGRIRYVSGPLRTTGDTGITGPIPRIAAFEDTGGVFGLDPEFRKADPVIDDMAVWFNTVKGLIVVTGCCHSGLVNTISYIRSLNEGAPVHTLIGGFHLARAPADRIEATCEYLFCNGIERIVPCHCTGENAIDYMEKRFGESVVVRGGAGMVLEM